MSCPLLVKDEQGLAIGRFSAGAALFAAMAAEACMTIHSCINGAKSCGLPG
jgi:hypothetical protein